MKIPVEQFITLPASSQEAGSGARISAGQRATRPRRPDAPAVALDASSHEPRAKAAPGTPPRPEPSKKRKRGRIASRHPPHLSLSRRRAQLTVASPRIIPHQVDAATRMHRHTTIRQRKARRRLSTHRQVQRLRLNARQIRKPTRRTGGKRRQAAALGRIKVDSRRVHKKEGARTARLVVPRKKEGPPLRGAEAGRG